MGIVFRGRGGSEAPVRTADTLKSTDTAEIVFGVGEGLNAGLANGLKSLFVGDTPIVNDSNESNFKDFFVNELLGSSAGAVLKTQLAGFAVPADPVGVELAHNQPVIRQGTQQNIDYIDLRLLISQLMRVSEEGDVYKQRLDVKIEYRVGAGAWQNAFLQSAGVPYGSTYSQTQGADSVLHRVGEADPETVTTRQGTTVFFAQNSTPSAPATGTSPVWLNNQGRPHRWVTNSWQAFPNLTDETAYWEASDTKIRYYKPSNTQPSEPNLKVGSTWVSTDLSTTRVWNGSVWVDGATGVPANSYTLPGFNSGGTIATDGILRFDDKVSTQTVYQVRFSVPKTNQLISVRVTRLTQGGIDNANYDNIINVQWESFTEIRAVEFNWPNTHILHIIGRATAQMSGLPEITGVVKGRIVKVPTNYDPITRTYNGIWNGTWKDAWTDNPAWITRDFITNTRYGLSALYPMTCKEMSFYAWAQWCDEAVPNNAGGTRPRWTFNDVIAEKRGAREYANYIAGSAGARLIDDGAGLVDVLIDRDVPASFVFTPENVADGEFSYSYTDIQTRANWIKVAFVNPELNWNVDYRVVEDPVHIAEFGRIPFEFVAVGKINESEALAAARHRLITSTTETCSVAFKTNRQGKYLRPWDIILVSDPDMGWGVTGRIRAVTGVRQVALRDAVTLEAGVSYFANFTRPTSPFTTVKVPITNGAGMHTVLNFGADLPADLPAQATFSLEAADGFGFPKPFRIISIGQADGSAELVDIVAVEVNRNKWAYIDGDGALLPTPTYVDFRPIGNFPPQNVSLEVSNRTVGDTFERVLSVTWDQVSNPLLQRVDVEYSYNGGLFQTVGSSRSGVFEMRSVEAGEHVFRLTRYNEQTDQRSRPVYVVHVTTDGVRFVPPVTNLRTVDQPSNTAFETTDVKFAWDQGVPDPNFKTFRVRVRNPQTSQIVRTVDTTAQEFTYHLTQNTSDFGGTPSRSFNVTVHRVDQFDNESPGVSLTVTNAAPATPTGVTITAVTDGILVRWNPATDRDYAGTIVTVGGTVRYDGTGSQTTVALTGSNHTVTVAHYDHFSKSGLNTHTTNNVSVPTNVVTDTTPPALPTGLAATSVPLGVSLAWTNPADADFSHVLIFRNTTNNSGTAVLRDSSSGRNWVDNDVVQGTTYWYFLRSVDRSGNQSALTTGVSAAPGAVDLAVDVGNRSLANLDATANTKLAGIAANATRNVVTYSATEPSSPVNGDFWVDTSATPNVTKARVAGAWQPSANLSTGELAEKNLIVHEMSNAGEWTLGTGQARIGMTGVHAVFRFWVGADSPEQAPASIDKDGRAKLRNVQLALDDGTVYFDSAQGGFTDAAKQAIYASDTGALPVTNVKQQALTWGASAGDGSILDLNLGADSQVTITTAWAPAGTSTVQSQFNDTVTLALHQRYRVNDAAAWGAWSQIGTVTVTRVTGTPGANEYRIYSYQYTFINDEGVQVTHTRWEVLDRGAVSSFGVTNATRSAGLYQFSVTGPSSTALGKVVTVTVTDVDGTPSIVLASGGSSDSVNYANPVGFYKNLKVEADGANTLTVTADRLVLSTPTGLLRTLGAVNLSVSRTAVASGGTGGLDTGSLAATTWYYVWVISNGAAEQIIWSLSATNPTMPAGYSYKARVGAFRMHVTSAFPRYVQRDDLVRYIVNASTAAANTQVVQGTAGTGSASSHGRPATNDEWGSFSMANFIPATAKTAIFKLYRYASGLYIAPNRNYRGHEHNQNLPVPAYGGAGAADLSVYEFALEDGNLYVASNDSRNTVLIEGWRDSI